MHSYLKSRLFDSRLQPRPPPRVPFRSALYKAIDDGPRRNATTRTADQLALARYGLSAKLAFEGPHVQYTPEAPTILRQLLSVFSFRCNSVSVPFFMLQMKKQFGGVLGGLYGYGALFSHSNSESQIVLMFNSCQNFMRMYFWGQ